MYRLSAPKPNSGKLSPSAERIIIALKVFGISYLLQGKRSRGQIIRKLNAETAIGPVRLLALKTDFL
jgi:hypothetical protein